MTLPLLASQILYAHLAWGLVLGAAGVGLLWQLRRFSLRVAAAWMLIVFAACCLPGAWSPAYWLALACQAPSALLLSLSVLAVWNRGQPRPEARVMTVSLAVVLLLTGTLLYADHWGWLYLGLYGRGFGPDAAFGGMVAGMVALCVIVMGGSRRTSLAVIVALLLYALWRLPTGNVWDAFIDPILWAWAGCSLVARGWRRGRVGAGAASRVVPPDPPRAADRLDGRVDGRVGERADDRVAVVA